VTWAEANDYCNNRAARLPTEVEWEYAARGPSNRVYPWGNRFIFRNAIHAENSERSVGLVGSRPDGVSWVGAMDMGGNLWEFTSTIHADYPYEASLEDAADTSSQRTVRGGSFMDRAQGIRTSIRTWVEVEGEIPFVGFRCVRDLDAPPPPTPEASPQSVFDESTFVIQEFDAIEMVLVPEGCFMMGSDDGEPDEMPVHEQCFEHAFWIDRNEVSNAQYGSADDSFMCEDNSAEPDQARICVNWAEASAHCESRGARLPTEAEWEYAARGPDSLVYPWGNEFVHDFVVYQNTSNFVVGPVGSRPGGVSWVGALNMSGNVEEWVSTIYDPSAYPYPYSSDDGREDLADTDAMRVQRGGSYGAPERFLRAADRRQSSPSSISNSTGFRCARDYEG
jgi:formylglycine-generating enzyme required for sulfatase activity